MADIFINLDEPLFVPSVDISLLDMVKFGNFTWPTLRCFDVSHRRH